MNKKAWPDFAPNPAHGRKAMLQTETNLEAIRQAVCGNCQRLRLAKANLEEALGKSFSDKTLRRFLKNTLQIGLLFRLAGLGAVGFAAAHYFHNAIENDSYQSEEGWIRVCSLMVVTLSNGAGVV